MYKYGFMGLVGFMIMGVGFMAASHASAWFILPVAFAMFGMMLRQNWLLAGGLLAWLIIRLLDGGLIGADVLILAGWGMMVAASNARCPRCESSVGTSAGMWRHSPVPAHCISCGRDRRDVWPFQYRLRPEPWDGLYHDEGGGPEPDSYNAEVIRYHAQERWRKKTGKT